MMRMSTILFLATALATTAVAGPGKTHSKPTLDIEKPVATKPVLDVGKPTVEVPDTGPDDDAEAEPVEEVEDGVATEEPSDESETPEEADETDTPEDIEDLEDIDPNTPFGQWVQEQKEAGLSGKDLADAILAEREARRGKAADGRDQRKAGRAVAKDKGHKRGK